MTFIEIPDLPVLRGEEAIKALSDFIKELEEEKSEELTVKQTKALTKFARGLISAIEAEAHSTNENKRIKKPRFIAYLKKTIMKYAPESVQAHENGQLWKKL